MENLILDDQQNFQKQDGLERIFEISLSTIIFAIIFLYTYAWFAVIPYTGFNYSPLSGEVSHVYIEDFGADGIMKDDVIISVRHRTFAENLGDRRVIMFNGIETGDKVPISVERNGQQIGILWEIPGLNRGEISFRLLSSWWVPFVLWFGGMFALLQVRPRDSRRYILAVSYFLTAVWLAAGLVSQYHIFYSSYVLHAGLWMSAPLAWQLALRFPKPLFPRSLYVWVFNYLIFFGIAVLDTVGKMPPLSYAIAGLLGAFGSLAIMLYRVAARPEQRRAMRQMFLALVLISLPIIALAVANLINPGMKTQSIVLAPIALFPLIHIYSIYRRRLGGMEVRINRAIGFLAFAILIFMLSATILLVITSFSMTFEWALISGVFVALVFGVLSAVVYPVFQSWFETYILGIRPPPKRIIEEYAGQIVTSLELDHLVALIRDEILPGLLVRQAALLRIYWSSSETEPDNLGIVFTMGVSDGQIPKLEAIPILINQAGLLRRRGSGDDQVFPNPWVKLVLPLTLRGQVTGILLLGKRDPDDRYSVNEIPTLQALMDQTALALANVDQANLLHAYYQNDISRQEAHSSKLVHELHDDVLSQMALLAQSVDQERAGAQFLDAYQNAVQHIRDIISGIRPTTLDQFGLEIALDELLDSLLVHAEYGEEPTPQIDLDITADSTRYPADVELNVYRIIQQASLNAIDHAKAMHIMIRGHLEEGYLELIVEDDGVGFLYGDGVDMGSLLTKKHFGLVGMHERAALIDARLQIESEIGQGTQVEVFWFEGQKGNY